MTAACTTILTDRWGTYVEWYADDDGNSGYGDNARRCVWYCSAAEARELAKQPTPPRGATWQPITDWQPDMSPGSAAWCEVQADNH